MRFKTPNFWRTKPGLVSILLLPIAYMYKLCSMICRWLKKPFKPPITVICVGNHVVGGAGKTPVVQAVAEYLVKQGCKPHIVSRGYGGRQKKIPHKVNTKCDRPHEVGDEPLLLAETAPTWVCKNKQAAVLAAYETGATHVILDDGLQSHAFQGAYNVLVLDPPYGFDNSLPFPAGPTRESLATAKSRAHMVLAYSDHGDVHQNVWAETTFNCDGASIVGFAGIGRPEKFKASLQQHACEVLEFHEFPDHHPYTQSEISNLVESAKKHKATLVTTAKDYVRIPKTQQRHVKVLSLKITSDQLSDKLASWI